MRSLELSLLKTCPVKCIYCPQPLLQWASKNVKESMMPLGKFDALLSNVSEGWHDIELHFAGFTEPLKHRDWKQFVLAAHLNDYVKKIVIYSTGEGLRKGDIEFLSEMPKLTEVNWHLADAPHVMAKGNGDFWDFLPEIKARMKYDCKVILVGDHVDNEKLIRSRLEGLNVEIGRQVSRSFNLQRQVGMLHEGNNRAVTCEKVRRHKMPVVLPDGTAVVCCNDYGLDFPLGNLFEQPWSELDYGEVLRQQAKSSSNCICHTDCHYARRA